MGGEWKAIVAERIWLVALSALLVAVSAVMWQQAQPVMHRAEAVVIAKPNSLNYDRLRVARSLLESYANKASFEDVVTEVVNELKLDQPVATTMEELSVSAATDSFLLRIEVGNSDRERAAQLAERINERFLLKFAQQQTITPESDRIFTLEPYSGARLLPPDTLETPVAALAGALLGMLGGAIIALLIEYLDGTLNSSAQMRRALGNEVQVLGCIPE